MEKLAAYVVREGALSTSDAVGWIARVCLTLAPIHVLGVAHGRVSTKAIQMAAPDCASEGFLLDAGDLLDDPAYFSPERLRGGPTSPADDCWALGVTLYSVLTGQLPFEGTVRATVLARIEKAPPSPLAVFDVGDDTIQSILDRVFAPQHDSRLRDLDELRAALVAWDRSLANVSALSFGKPRADDDDDDAVMTSVYQFRGESKGSSGPGPAAGKDEAGKVPHDSKPPPGPLPETSLEAADPDSVEPDSVVTEPLSARAESKGSEDAAAADPTSAEPMVVRKKESNWPPRREHVLAEAEEQRVRSTQRLVLIGALVIGGIGGGVYAMMQSDGGSATAPSGTPTATATAPPAATTGAPTATSTASAASTFTPSATPTVSAMPSASATASAQASTSAVPKATSAPSATPRSPADRDACAVELFPADTFTGRSPDFSFMCLQTDPVEGAGTMHRQVVVARGIRGVTDGMREWSTMRWYAMAAFAITRARCCEAPAPLEAPPQHATCALGPSLEALGAAVKAGNEEQASDAVAAYQKAVNCLFSTGAARTYMQRHVPTPIGANTFQKMLARANKR